MVRISHLLSNIPFSNFYGSILSEFLRIARCTLKLDDFIMRGKELFVSMVNQIRNTTPINECYGCVIYIYLYISIYTHTHNHNIHLFINKKLIIYIYNKLC